MKLKEQIKEISDSINNFINLKNNLEDEIEKHLKKIDKDYIVDYSGNIKSDIHFNLNIKKDNDGFNDDLRLEINDYEIKVLNAGIYWKEIDKIVSSIEEWIKEKK